MGLHRRNDDLAGRADITEWEYIDEDDDLAGRGDITEWGYIDGMMTWPAELT